MDGWTDAWMIDVVVVLLLFTSFVLFSLHRLFGLLFDSSLTRSL